MNVIIWLWRKKHDDEYSCNRCCSDWYCGSCYSGNYRKIKTCISCMNPQQYYCTTLKMIKKDCYHAEICIYWKYKGKISDDRGGPYEKNRNLLKSESWIELSQIIKLVEIFNWAGWCGGNHYLIKVLSFKEDKSGEITGNDSEYRWVVNQSDCIDETETSFWRKYRQDLLDRYARIDR